MRAATRVLVTLATASAVASLPLSAQDAPRTRGFGLTAGVLSSSISDLDFGVDEFGASASTSRRIGFQIGAFAERRLNDRLSVRPELLYVQKGATADVTETGGDGASVDLTLGYVELPLLLRVDLGAPSNGRTRLFLEGGPAVAFRTQCETSVESGGLSVSIDCDEFGGDELRRFDAGLALGGGVAFRLGARDASFGLRYTQALTTLSDDGDRSPRNNVIAGVFSIALR